MNTDILKSDSSKTREINTDSLKIHGNCMEFLDTVIQLSNISLISTNSIIPTKFPVWSIAAIIIGIFLLTLKAVPVILLGLVAAAVGVFAIYSWYQQMEREKSIKKLVIATNSGQTFSILFEKGEFLETVIQVLKEIIANPGHLSDVNFNIKGNTFTQSAAIFREYTEVNSRGGDR